MLLAYSPNLLVAPCSGTKQKNIDKLIFSKMVWNGKKVFQAIVPFQAILKDSG
jgi:hypothetical protein